MSFLGGLGSMVSNPIQALTGGLTSGNEGVKTANANFAFETNAANKLNELLNNPGSVTSMPGFAAGQEAVMRKVASQGGNLSGAQLTALQDYGLTYYNNQLSILQQLASGYESTARGANTSSGSASSGLGGIMSLLMGQNGMGGTSGILGQIGKLFGGGAGGTAAAGAATGAEALTALGGDAGIAAGASDLVEAMAVLA